MNKGEIKRMQYMREMLLSIVIGELITVIIFSQVHQIFTRPGEVIAFWMGTHMVAVYVVWSLIIMREEVNNEKRTGNAGAQKDGMGHEDKQKYKRPTKRYAGERYEADAA